MPTAHAARRLPPAERRAQLARAALEVAAAEGYANFSLDHVAERAGVTRNLVYHYFPRGRLDLFLAALEHAGTELTAGWVTDPEVPLEQRVAVNFAQMMEHAGGPSPAWRIHRQARTMLDPDVRALTKRYVDQIVSNVALNNTGSADPPPLVRLAIEGFVAYAELALEEARERDLDDRSVIVLLARTLAATIDAAGDL
jgi:AcrR family transcriptional regulator